MKLEENEKCPSNIDGICQTYPGHIDMKCKDIEKCDWKDKYYFELERIKLFVINPLKNRINEALYQLQHERINSAIEELEKAQKIWQKEEL